VEEAQLQEHSYGALLGRALELAPALRRLSAQNEIVGVMMPSCSVTLALFLGLSAMRRVPAMLNPSASPEGLRAACAAACMRSIVTSRALFDEAHLARLAAQLPGVRIHLAEDLRPARGPGARLWLAWARRFPRAAAVAQTPDAPAVVLFTSGSEGRPKGVVHSHNSLLSNVAQIRSVADFSPLDKFMMALPLFHAFGLTCGLMLPLVSGCKVFLYPNPLHYRAIPEVVYDRNCTVLFGTSSLLSRYASFAHPYDFGRLRYVVAGAEKLSEDVRQQWIHKFGIRILEGYGVTECAPVVAVNVPMACRTGSVGQIVPGMEYALEPVAGAEGGVLHVRGPNVMMGYLLEDRPGQIQACASRGHGWVCTGDIVQIDEDDFIHVRGRLRRFLRIEGELVSLDLAEQIAAAASPGHRHAVCARADAAGTEHLILFTTAPCLDADRLRAAARAIDATRRAVPPLKRELASLPMLASGKVDYLALEQVAQNIES
jgi:acyl-[acyl-carrier-protein]-phospholipid O-acyltransferase/long-chain-fatty-acid--[acyl-carrier-protein] ligase